MKRNKFGQQYYCLVGGGIDNGETADQAALREAYEEASLTLGNPRLVYIEEAGKPFGTQYVFLCDYQDGDVHVHPDSIEATFNQDGQNLFQPMWVPISKFAGLSFYSKELQQEILTAFRDGFPKEPKMFTSQAK